MDIWDVTDIYTYIHTDRCSPNYIRRRFIATLQNYFTRELLPDYLGSEVPLHFNISGGHCLVVNCSEEALSTASAAPVMPLQTHVVLSVTDGRTPKCHHKTATFSTDFFKASFRENFCQRTDIEVGEVLCSVSLRSADVLTCATIRTRTRLGDRSFSVAGPCL